MSTLNATESGARASLMAEFREFLAEGVYALYATTSSLSSPLPRCVYEEAGRRGYFCLQGREGLTPAECSLLLLNELGASCLPGFSYWVHSEIFCRLLRNYGSDEVKDKYLDGCFDGTYLGAVGLTEATGGSSLTGIQTRVRMVSGGYLLSGEKLFVSLAPFADLLIVSALTEERRPPSLFLVERLSPGVSVVELRNCVSMRELASGAIRLSDVFVPADNLLALDATIPLVKSLAIERFICALVACSMAESVLRQAVAHIRTHSVGSAPICSFQPLRARVAGAQARLQCVHALVDKQSEKFLAGRRLRPVDAAICKLEAAGCLREIAALFVEAQGARGVLGDPASLRQLNDAYAQSVYGGTNDVMREIIASDLLGA